MHRLTLSISLLLLAACARTEDASVAPEGGSEGYSTVDRVREPQRDDQEVALGEWRRSLQQEQVALEFGPAGTQPLLSIVCGERGGIVLQRHGMGPMGGAQMMAIIIGGSTRELPVTAASGTAPMPRAIVGSGEPLLAQLGSAQGPITFRLGDGVPLILPPSPLLGEYMQACAGGPQPRLSGAPVPADPATNGAAAAEPAAGNETQPRP